MVHIKRKHTSKLPIRMRNSIAALVLGGSLLAPTALSPVLFASSAYASDTDTAITALANSLVNLSTEINSNTTNGMLENAVLQYISGFQQSDWDQVLFGSTTLTDSQKNAASVLVSSLSSFLTLGNPTSPLTLDQAKSKVMSVVSSMESLSSSITDADAVTFLQNLKTNMYSAILTDPTSIKSDIASAVQTSYASLPHVKAIFIGSDAGTVAIGGSDGEDGGSTDSTTSTFDPTSLDSYRWLQHSSGDVFDLLGSLDPSKFQSELSSIDANTKHLVIPMQKDAKEVQLTSSVLDGLRSKLSTNAALTLSDGSSTYDLPLSVIPTNASQVVVSIAPADVSTQSQIAQSLQKLAQENSAPAASLGAPIDFKLSVQTPTGVQTVSDFGHTYTTRSLSIPDSASFDPNATAVVMWDAATQSLLPVPATITRDSSGHTHAVIHRTGNSVYEVISYKKTFSDLTPSLKWAQPAISRLTSKLVLSGTSITAFSPNSDITRAEFITMLVRALGLTDKPVSQDLGQVFDDVKSTDWFAQNVAIAKESGLVSGDESNHFNPGQQISRQEMATMIANAIKFVNPSESSAANVLQKFTDHSSIQPWAANAASLVVSDGIISGRTTTTFAPKANATRAEAAVMIEKLLEHEGFSDPLQ